MNKSWKGSDDGPVALDVVASFDAVVIDLPASDDQSSVETTEDSRIPSVSADNNCQLLEDIPNENRLNITFKSMSCRAISEPGKTVLSEVTGTVQSGEILAVMGASGSGKTTLLTAVGGRTPPSVEVTGTLLYNDGPSRCSMKGFIGFVHQDDQLFPTLTVWETLMYIAKLRLPRSFTVEQKAAQVERVILALGLSRCRDTLVGDVSIRGISGGERKRVSIAQELLASPSVILLDEPTSGLDSTTALRLIRTLHGLASGGRSIMMTIHQPSHRVYQQLDKLMLLSKGETVYYGQVSAATSWMASHGVHSPPGLGTTDFMLDVASGTHMAGDNNEEDDCKTCEESEAGEATRKMLIAEFRKADAGPLGWAAAGPNFHAAQERPQPPEDTSPSSSAAEDEERSWETGWVSQCLVLLSRTLRARRFEAFGFHAAVQQVLPAVLLGLIWWQVTANGVAVASLEISGLLFFMLVFQFHINNIRACFTFPPDMAMVRKERASGMYRLSAYYIAKTLADIPIDLLWPTIFFVILYFMTGLRLDPAWTIFANWGTLVLVVLTAQGMGQFFGAALPTVKHAHAITSVVECVMLLTAGYFVRTMPVWIGWLRYTSVVYYGYNILLHLQLSGVDGSEASSMPGAASLFPERKLPNDGVSLEIGVIFAFLLFFRVMTYFALRGKTCPPSKKNYMRPN